MRPLWAWAHSECLSHTCQPKEWGSGGSRKLKVTHSQVSKPAILTTKRVLGVRGRVFQSLLPLDPRPLEGNIHYTRPIPFLFLVCAHICTCTHKRSYLQTSCFGDPSMGSFFCSCCLNPPCWALEEALCPQERQPGGEGRPPDRGCRATRVSLALLLTTWQK